MEDMTQILNLFCTTHKKLYLYGAGTYGCKLLAVLHDWGLDVDGFLVTDGPKRRWMGKTVLPLREAQPLFSDAGVILALSETWHPVIRKNLSQTGVDIFSMRDAELRFLYNHYTLLPLLRHLTGKLPVAEKLPILTDVKKILVIRLDVLGDLLMTIPMLRELRRNVPQAQIDMVVRDDMVFLLKDCTYLDRLVPFAYDKTDAIDVDGILNFVKNLNESYDMVILPRELLNGRTYAQEAVMAVLASSCRVGRLPSFDDDMLHSPLQEELRGELTEIFTHVIWQETSKHEVQYMLDIVDVIGGKVYDDKMEYAVPDKSRLFADEIWRLHDLKSDDLVLAIGLVSQAPERTWPTENYLRLLKILREYCPRIHFLLLGGTDARKAASAFTEHTGVIDMTGKTSFPEAAGCMEKCQMYVGANTGLLHFASALKKPIVEISAWLPNGLPVCGIAPSRMGAYGTVHVTCQPVQGMDGCTGFCRRAEAHCIKNIAVEDVAMVVKNLLAGM